MRAVTTKAVARREVSSISGLIWDRALADYRRLIVYSYIVWRNLFAPNRVCISWSDDSRHFDLMNLLWTTSTICIGQPVGLSWAVAVKASPVQSVVLEISSFKSPTSIYNLRTDYLQIHNIITDQPKNLQPMEPHHRSCIDWLRPIPSSPHTGCWRWQIPHTEFFSYYLTNFYFGSPNLYLRLAQLGSKLLHICGPLVHAAPGLHALRPNGNVVPMNRFGQSPVWALCRMLLGSFGFMLRLLLEVGQLGNLHPIWFGCLQRQECGKLCQRTYRGLNIQILTNLDWLKNNDWASDIRDSALLEVIGKGNLRRQVLSGLNVLKI